MTPEEAMDRIDIMISDDKLWEHYTQDGKIAFQNALKASREAIKKKVPAKPVHDGVENQCPQCGNYVSETRENIAWVQYEVIEFDGSEVFRDKYCSECGQAIDWSDEE
ncbi:hypothetical protein KCG48_10570 [Proteiniclasticum sp. BAD-10]|uniref:Uncharacterized protein n=1 Tax=Proteiniclasticum sediminis TaxID=2804028 RepID=A0A941HQU5_9CLOT|nr:hypothetical protein [Proteiniclasticum sediminis]MBR0576776.1 hypothetical protein [Proteiniclasticum sediminis]